MSIQRQTALPLFLFLAAVLLSAPAHAAADAKKYLDDDFVASLRDWLSHPVVQISITSQNRRLGNLGQANIDALDEQWQGERDAGTQPLIAATLNSPLSNYLTQIQARSLGLYSEIFVMDAHGLNVGQSAITSDYWQGDEAKFQQTFDVATDAIFIDEAEFNDDTQTWRAQVNMTLSDDAGQRIGAATIEVNLTELERRRKAGVR